MTQSLPPQERFLGLNFHPLNLDETVDYLAASAQDDLPFRYVVTPNVDHMVRLERENDLRPYYESAWLCVCDSRILEILARLDGLSLPPAPGADIVQKLFETAIEPDEAITVIGGDENLIAKLKDRYSLTSVAWHNPPMGMRHKPEAIDAAAQFIVDHPSKWVFLCVGSPQQEILAKAIAERGDAKGIGLCCGASLDFLTGKVKRAPEWMRTSRLEWLHRLLSEPRRLGKRYLVDGTRIFSIWLKHRRKK